MMRAYVAEVVRQAEAPLLAAGVPLMRQAARSLALTAVREIRARGQMVSGSVVLGLVGGGNNGGDALYALADLSRRGAAAHAALLSPSVHGQALAAARAAGVEILHASLGDGSIDAEGVLMLARRAGVWFDGIAGIGLAGALREPLAGLVESLAAENDASPDRAVVIAVDVPSGVGDDGAIRGAVLPADVTVTMGVAKPGLLLPPADGLAGRVDVVELGLPMAGLPVAAARLNAADVADLYPWPRRDDHKYTRGVVAIWAGDGIYPGAANLACRGALAVGPGMVRYRGGAPTLEALPEVVRADGRIQAALVGPGMEEGNGVRAAMDEALSRGVPLVVDAGALSALEDMLGRRAEPAPCVVTPHAGELARLLGIGRKDVEARPALRAREYAERTGTVVLLKGSTTLVVSPARTLYSQAEGVAWQATAGSGDVLAGILGGLLALAQARAEEYGGVLGEEEVAALAAGAAWIHGSAGRLAAHGGPLRAGAIADATPAVIAGLIAD